jgi:hypothetical protein
MSRRKMGCGKGNEIDCHDGKTGGSRDEGVCSRCVVVTDRVEPSALAMSFDL